MYSISPFLFCFVLFMQAFCVCVCVWSVSECVSELWMWILFRSFCSHNMETKYLCFWCFWNEDLFPPHTFSWLCFSLLLPFLRCHHNQCLWLFQQSIHVSVSAVTDVIFVISAVKRCVTDEQNRGGKSLNDVAPGCIVNQATSLSHRAAVHRRKAP